jgi:intracellular sulfur oxidation DsrE/DsrF family protein
LEIVLIQDGMDQSKFQAPRSSLVRAKVFESFNRPRLHVAGVICHGRHVALYLSEPDVAKDSNTSCEILAHTLHELAQQGVDLSACKVTLQADNTSREVKDGILMRFVAALVSDQIISAGRLSFLRSGHSHEDIDQLFGSVSSYFKNHVRTALTSHDFVVALQEFCRQLDRPHEPRRFVVKLDRTRDWHLDLHKHCFAKVAADSLGTVGEFLICFSLSFSMLCFLVWPAFVAGVVGWQLRCRLA